MQRNTDIGLFTKPSELLSAKMVRQRNKSLFTKPSIINGFKKLWHQPINNAPECPPLSSIV